MDYELILITVLGIAIVANVLLMVAALPRLRPRDPDRRALTADMLARSAVVQAPVTSPASPPTSQQPLAGPNGTNGPNGPNGPNRPNGHQPRADALLDPATGLDTPLLWNQRLHDEHARGVRYGRPATVVVCELDGLERLVGRFGQAAADRLVPAVANTLRREARRSDHVARLGPGRFGVLLPEADEVTAINYVERVRAVCEMWLEAGAVAVRLATGWAALSGEVDVESVLHTANARLDQDRRRIARATGSAVDLAASDVADRIGATVESEASSA